MTVTIGDYDEEMHAAVAYDLAVRVLGGGEYNFSDAALRRLVRAHGRPVLDGLDPRLPSDFREAIERLADRFGRVDPPGPSPAGRAPLGGVPAADAPTFPGPPAGRRRAKGAGGTRALGGPGGTPG